MKNIFAFLALITIAICNGTLYDEMPDESPGLFVRSIETQTKLNKNLIQPDDKYFRQRRVWEVIGTMDSYKSSRIYSQSSSRPTLTSYHYLIQPIWWRDQTQTDPVDRHALEIAMDETVEYYSDMSWGKMNITYEILDQTVLRVRSTQPSLHWSKKQCENYVNENGFVRGFDYDGIIMIFPLAQSGDLAHHGGYGETNGNFIWISDGSLKRNTFRHEIGHNLGQDHHGRNTYWYRTTRPESTGITDGFDMMGGGNKYEISDFNLASKWFYNWIEDSSIVKMQPEGPTPECPTCLKSGTFTLKAFDMRNTTPHQLDKLGIHIPITTIFDDNWNTDYVYSYWISYRAGVDGHASGGVSIHNVWWELYGDSGSYFYSMMYDTSGHTESKFDSFLGTESCYHISPSAYMKDRDSDSVEEVQPVVCVGEINDGIDITVSVSFLDKDNLPPARTNFDEHPTLDCSDAKTQISKTFDSTKFSIIHVKANGSTINLSVASSDSTAYFYDDFPYSSIYFNSDAGYGSFGYLEAGSTMKYDSAYEDVWILMPPSFNAVNSITIQCEAKDECVSNHYLENEICTACPSNMVAGFGSTSISACNMCPPGTKLLHSSSSHCTLSQEYTEISESKSWRIWVPNFHAISGWSWAVLNLAFYADVYCETLISESGFPIDSGNAGVGYGPENAFGLGMYSHWGGRMDDSGAFWIGMTFDELTSIKCMQIESLMEKHVNEIRVQVKDEADTWQNVWIQKLDAVKQQSLNTIQLYYSNGSMATVAPTSYPTLSPSISPTLTSNPTTKKTLTSIPSTHPSKTPTDNETIKCKENPSTKYLFKVKNNGQVVGRTCLSLSKKSPNRIRSICFKTIYTEKTTFAPAKIACPVTCGCSDDGDEDKTCTQTASHTFLLRIKYQNGNPFPIRRSCQWLEGRPQNAKSLICQTTETINGIQPASNVCFKSCKSC